MKHPVVIVHRWLDLGAAGGATIWWCTDGVMAGRGCSPNAAYEDWADESRRIAATKLAKRFPLDVKVAA